MKYLYIFLLIEVLNTNIYSQLIIEENFDYAPGILSQVSGVWIETVTNNTRSVQVSDTNLSYNAYPSSSGNAVYLDGGTGGRGAKRLFATVSGNNNSVYVSFLLTVNNLDELFPFNSSGDWFFCLHNQYGNTKAFIYIKKSYKPDLIRLGLGKSFTPVIYDSTDILSGSTNLIVLKYKFIAASDSVTLWINPSTSGLEPPPNVVNPAGTDINDIAGIEIRQKDLSGNLFIDGIRVARNWNEAPLPVELSSFTAQLKNDHVLLNWRTETEVNNYGFDIEKSYLRNNIKSEFRKIGFIDGSGNSNSPKEYNFIDCNPSKGRSFYRLKQIDSDGNYEYSFETEASNPINEITLSIFPNPANSSSTISYSLPEKQNIRLAVYNVLGEMQYEIFSGPKESGTYEDVIDLAGISSGVYVVVLSSPGNIVITKGIVLK